MTEEEFYFNDRLKVLSYWNLNNNNNYPIKLNNGLKVLSYWNLNGQVEATDGKGGYLL